MGYFAVESQADRRDLPGLLDRMGLAADGRPRLGTLSGGEVQRLVLARALAQEAPILLLDEPTSALDLGRRVDALELVDELRRERSLTVLSAIHDLTLAGQFADRLLLLHQGRVAVTGDPASVLRDDVLSRPFRRTAAGADHGGRGAGGHLTASRSRVSRPGGQTPRSRPMISFMISVVPPKIVCTRPSANARATGYSAHVAVAAVKLHAAVHDPVAQLGVPPLDHGRVSVGQLAVGVLEHRPVGEGAGHGQLGGHLGQHEPVVLEAADRPAEGLPLLAVVQRVLEHLSPPPASAVAPIDDPLPGQVLHERDEPAALLAKQVRRRARSRRRRTAPRCPGHACRPCRGCGPARSRRMPRSTTSRLIPRCPASGSVRATTMTRSASCPLEMNVFCPLST